MSETERQWLRDCAQYLRLCAADGVFLSGRRCMDLAARLDEIAAGAPPPVIAGNVVPFVRPADAPAPLAQEKQS